MTRAATATCSRCGLASCNCGACFVGSGGTTTAVAGSCTVMAAVHSKPAPWRRYDRWRALTGAGAGGTAGASGAGAGTGSGTGAGAGAVTAGAVASACASLRADAVAAARAVASDAPTCAAPSIAAVYPARRLCMATRRRGRSTSTGVTGRWHTGSHATNAASRWRRDGRCGHIHQQVQHSRSCRPKSSQTDDPVPLCASRVSWQLTTGHHGARAQALACPCAEAGQCGSIPARPPGQAADSRAQDELT